MPENTAVYAPRDGFGVSDLAVEDFGFAAPVPGIKTSPCTVCGYHALISETPHGSYRTIVSGRAWEYSSAERIELADAAAECISFYAEGMKSCLVAGIGNPDIPADALGARTALRVSASRRNDTIIRAVCPMTFARTGIDTALYIRALADAVRPDVIIAADALCAKSRSRLQTVIQISDCGITPGSALAHTCGEISSKTMPCPVISIGVPTVISTASMDDSDPEPLLVTRAESDIITDCYASVIAAAINTAFFGK